MAKKRKVNQTIDVLVGKNKELQDAYNELTVSFNDSCDLVVRAYDEGVAYHFVTRLNGEITIISEDAIFNFASTQPSIIRNAMLIIPAKRINPDVPSGTSRI